MNERPPYRLAILASGLSFVLYVLTLAPTTQFWDTSEYIAAAYVLGIPHPPGNPLFVLLAHVWGDLLVFIQPYAARINLFAATTSAVATGCWFLIGERWLRPIVPVRTVRLLTAGAGALVAATTFTVWNQSVVNAKVYTVSLMSTALILWLGVRWSDLKPGPVRDRLLLVILYLLALTSTNHMMGVLVGSAVIVLGGLVLWEEGALEGERAGEWAKGAVVATGCAVLISLGMEDMRIVVAAGVAFGAAVLLAGYTGSYAFAALAVLAVAVGLSVNGMLPIRAAHFPPINEGEPTTWPALRDVLTREQYGKGPLSERQADIGAQYGLYWQYFTWQWSRAWQLRWPEIGASIGNAVGVVFAALGLLGAWRHFKADWRHALAMTALLFTLVGVLVYYLNFKYGYSQLLAQAELLREVRERDYFFLASFGAWGVWVGLGIATLLEWVREALSERVGADRAWRLATPVLLIAFIPLIGNWRAASRAGETLARDFAVDLLNGLEPYAILVTAGDNDTFPLWYAQEVEGVRRDVTVLNLSLGNTDWHLKQLQRRPVEPYDVERGPALFADREWPVPEGSLFRGWTLPQLDSLPLFVPIDRPRGFTAGTLSVVIDPARLPQGLIDRATLAVLQTIRDHLGRRPIYFSRTAGGMPDQIGLGAYLVSEGFGRRLRAVPVQPSDSVVSVPGYGFLDVPRTSELLWEVYHGDTAARPRPFGWVDHPSEGIITLYAIGYAALAEALRTTDSTLSARSSVRADSVLANTSFGRRQGLAPLD
jgi:hypothetical protein